MTDNLSIIDPAFAVIFRRWDAASEVGEFVQKFQGTTS